MKKEYRPIPCSFYDEIEIAAMRGQSVKLVLLEDGLGKELITTILNTQTRKDGEFILTKDGEFRMDTIVSLNGSKPSTFC